MRYIYSAQGSSLSAKILGTYEMELHSCVNAAITIGFERIINIGAGEGYYAVGLACSASPGRQIIAYEADERAHELIRTLAEWNRVSNLTICGRCSPDGLDKVVCSSGKVLIICDVEGFEAELLDPLRIRNLEKAWVLVELHEFIHAGISEIIISRFRQTHKIDEITSRPRDLKDFPSKTLIARLLPETLSLRAMNEGRPGRMSWLWMRPIAAPDERSIDS